MPAPILLNLMTLPPGKRKRLRAARGKNTNCLIPIDDLKKIFAKAVLESYI